MEEICNKNDKNLDNLHNKMSSLVKKWLCSYTPGNSYFKDIIHFLFIFIYLINYWFSWKWKMINMIHETTIIHCGIRQCIKYFLLLLSTMYNCFGLLGLKYYRNYVHKGYTVIIVHLYNANFWNNSCDIDITLFIVFIFDLKSK